MNDPQETHFDFKKITFASWQIPDTTTELWRTITAAAKTNEEWVEFFLSPKLDPKVPAELAKLLEVARASMIYSWYFYPLATLGAQQCYRVLETGVRLRCEWPDVKTNSSPKKGNRRRANFKMNVDSLLECGVISNAHESRWTAARDLRNMSSHLSRQEICDPGMAFQTLSLVVTNLNDLFR
jgi:hypothetical protein